MKQTPILVLFSILFFISQVLSAGIITAVPTRAALGGNDFIDWGQLGPDFTVVTSLFNVTSHLGVGPNTVANSTQDFYSEQQGNSWGGNFANGDNVLFNQAGGPFTITLASPVQGLGMQFQSLNFGAFTASITAFGAGNVSFGTVTKNGLSNNAANNSAIFLGVLSNMKDIVKIQTNVTIGAAAPSNDPFAVNRMDLLTTAAPEPTTMALLAAGLGWIAWKRRKSA